MLSPLMRICKEHWAGICLLIIILIGLSLRLYHLSFQNYFPEELMHTGIIRFPWYTAFTQIGSEQAPLYYVFAKIGVTTLNGLSLVSLRFPAAIFGTLCIPAIYLLGTEFSGKLTGILSALVIALSDRAVFYSQYGRPYSLLMLFFIITAYCFVKIQRPGNRNQWLLLFTIASVLCLWSHYYSIVPLSVVWVIVVWQNYKKIAPYLIVVSLSSILFILYLRSLIGNYLTYPFSSIHPQSIFNVTLVDMLVRVPYECWGYLGTLLIPLFVFYLLQRKETVTEYFGLVVIVTYLSLLIGTFISNPGARYAIMITPVVIVPAMTLVSEFIRNRRDTLQKIILVTGVAYVIFVVNLFSLISWYTTAYHFVFL